MYFLSKIVRNKKLNGNFITNNYIEYRILHIILYFQKMHENTSQETNNIQNSTTQLSSTPLGTK